MLKRGISGVMVVLLLLYGTVFGMPMATQAAGNTYYVATTGNDSNAGTLSSPFKSIAKAASVMVAGDTCIIRGGTYREVIQPTKSGTAGNPITYKAYAGETVTLSAAEKVTGWTLHSGNIYKAPMNWNLGMENQVFVNGEMMHVAQYPNWTDTNIFNPGRAKMESGADLTVTYSGLNKPADYWKGGFIWIRGTWTAQTTTIAASSGNQLTLAPFSSSDGRYTGPLASREFFVFNLFSELDTEREWFYDSSTQTMYLWAPGGVNPSTLNVEIKKRNFCIDLTGVSYVNIEGLNTFGGTIRMADNSSNNIVKGIDAKYISHRMNLQKAYEKDDTGIYVGGSNNTLRDSKLAYSSGNLIIVAGSDNKIINNLAHEANYMVTYNANMFIKGKRHLISYNTLYNAARDLMQLEDIDASIIEYNDLSLNGLLGTDCGGIYVTKEDGEKTEIRYNRIHDLLATTDHGIYLDQHSHNFIIHHNTVWNMDFAGIKSSQPGNFVQIYDNMVDGKIKHTFGTAFNNDGYGTRIYNNVATEGFEIDGDAKRYDNKTVGYDQNLYPPAGQNLANPPNPVYALTTPQHTNLLKNAFFDAGLESWAKTGAPTTAFYRATYDPIHIDNGETRSGYGSVQFGSGQNGVEQLITGLQPNTTYEYSAWARVPLGETVEIGVKDYGDLTIYKSVYGNSPNWTRQKVQFKTGASQTSAKVYIWKSSLSAGLSYGDDAGLIQVEDTVPLIVDNGDPNYSEISGSWLDSSLTGYNGSMTRYAREGASAKWTAPITVARTYDVYINKVIHSTSDTNTKVDVVHNGVTSTVYEDYSTGTPGWKHLGTYSMTPGQSNYVQITRGNNSLRADAVKFVASNQSFDPAVNYKIINKKSGKLLDIANSSSEIGAKAIQLGNLGGESKRWQIIYNGNDYSLVNKSSGMAVDVAGSAITSGADVVQSLYHGMTSQGWQIANAGNGYYKIINTNSGMAAAVKGGSLADGAEIIQSPYAGNDSQLWSMVLDTGGETWVVDNGEANYSEVSGSWVESSAPGYNGSKTRYSTSSGASAKWTAPITVGGTYEVFIYKPINSNSDTNTKVEIVHNGTTNTVYENYSTGTSSWKLLGTYTMTPGQSNYVKITRGNQTVRADAVKFVKVD
ncbi:RICIN domain-containing protein [Paenibacillus chondroitinus]|uniref:RICIN domain-containing protein n=1 Tax=Paenibacillus chondroitinus TaxID=59842 RepID=A0ABU6D9N4_9BACL|nr:MULTISPECIES: RICIN domain-containing protein [Paenibacillus]MCY9656807.1 RICIN domain-containing protein [Paenibacillus anseongense]MEB4794457.1 RICIN domain-containing protein [Paenibacillus chondroitinus]